MSVRRGGSRVDLRCRERQEEAHVTVSRAKGPGELSTNRLQRLASTAFTMH